MWNRALCMLIKYMRWQVIEAQVDMPIVGAITLYVSLLTFTLRVHPDRLDYVDQVLVCCLLMLVYNTELSTYNFHLTIA
jgi:hypothetical protein